MLHHHHYDHSRHGIFIRLTGNVSSFAIQRLYEKQQTSENSQTVNMYHNFYIKSKDNTVICMPGYTAGHLDAYSASRMVPKAHMGHLVPCSAAAAAAADLSKKSGWLQHVRKPIELLHRVHLFLFDLSYAENPNPDGAL